MAEEECFSRRRDKVTSLLLLVALLTLIGGLLSLQKTNETFEEQIKTTINQNGSKSVISNKDNNNETTFVNRSHTMDNDRPKQQQQQQQPTCTSESYQQYLTSGKDFAKLDFPFQEVCLKPLIDADPADITL